MQSLKKKKLKNRSEIIPDEQILAVIKHNYSVYIYTHVQKYSVHSRMK